MTISAGMSWPPPTLEQVQDRVNESQVWWVGDAAKLNEYYQRSSGTQQRSSRSRIRDAYNAFWGRPNQNPTQPLKRLHVPIGGDIVKLSASTLFGEPLSVLAAEVDTELQSRIDALFNTPTFHSDLFAAGESCSALGGAFIRVVWDRTIANHAWLDFVDADKAIPEWRWGRLVAVTFWSELDSDDPRIVYRHLERHEVGRIIHQLFQGTATNLGRLVPLTDHPDTEGMQVDAEASVPTGVDELTAAYVPNVLPNPEWRNHPTLRYLGRSDLSSDVIPLMDQYDELATSLGRDFRIGKARMYASESVLTTLGRGNGQMLSEDQEVFTTVGSGMNKDGSMETLFQFHQPDIRVEDHTAGMDVLLREILRRTGYSPISFGIADEVAQTATEAAGKAKLTVTTTKGKARHWSAGLGPLITTCLRVDAYLFDGIAPSEDVTLEWPQFAKDSDEAKGRTVQAWEAAGAASTRTKVAYLHEDWDAGQVDEEAALIDSANVMASPFGSFGSDTNPDPDAPTPDADAVDEDEQAQPE